MSDARNRPSTIDRLPEELRARISSLRDQGRTIDEIMGVLNSLDAGVSRSAVGRHLKKMDRIAADIRKSRSLAEAVSRQFGDKEVSQVARTNIELLHTLIMKVMIGSEDNDTPIELDAKEAMFVATALEKLSKAGKLDLDAQILAVKETERRAATEKAADVAATEARKQGLSATTIEAIKKSILGVE